MNVPADCPPPPRRMDPVRVEALRAAAKVHEGHVKADHGFSSADQRLAVLTTAEDFVVWLTEHQT